MSIQLKIQKIRDNIDFLCPTDRKIVLNIINSKKYNKEELIVNDNFISITNRDRSIVFSSIRKSIKSKCINPYKVYRKFEHKYKVEEREFENDRIFEISEKLWYRSKKTELLIQENLYNFKEYPNWIINSLAELHKIIRKDKSKETDKLIITQKKIIFDECAQLFFKKYPNYYDTSK